MIKQINYIERLTSYLRKKFIYNDISVSIYFLLALLIGIVLDIVRLLTAEAPRLKFLLWCAVIVC